jgi:hypothetical protein
MAAFLLFQKAAEAEQVTLVLLQELASSLEQAQRSTERAEETRTQPRRLDKTGRGHAGPERAPGNTTIQLSMNPPAPLGDG